jgi:hypothetical protein
LPSCPLVFASLVVVVFRFVIQNVSPPFCPQRSRSFLETLGMMPNFAGVEKFFTTTTFKKFGAAGSFLSEAILPARNPKRKNPGAGRRVKGGSRGHTEERP